MPKQDPHNEIFDLLLFLVTSARVAVDEPKRYGSFRLFQAYRKLLELTPKLDTANKEIYEEMLSELDSKKQLVASSSSAETKEYASLLDELIEMMVGGL